MRGKMARQGVENIKHENEAAVALQSVVRGHKARVEVHEIMEKEMGIKKKPREKMKSINWARAERSLHPEAFEDYVDYCESKL